MHMHVFEYGIKSLSEERFGYFVRKSLEYRDRIRNNLAHLPQLTHEMFDYIDDMTAPLENVWIQSEITNKICKKRHGIKNEERLLSKNRTNLQILKEIEDCAKKPVTLALKEFLFDMYPNLFEIVDPTNIHDFGYDEDEDDDDEDKVDNVEDESKVILPSELIMSSEKNECVICLENRFLLVWPCHKNHLTCKNCVIKIILRTQKLRCPLCRFPLKVRQQIR